jgi:histidyl-tRNA synthetase
MTHLEIGMSLDTLRQQSAQIRYLEQQLHDHMALYGYEYISLPFIEPSDIFLTRAGDKIIDRLFTFDRFGRQLALRPEFTAAAANTYVAHHQTEVVRWQFSGAVFEDEPSDYTLEYQKYSIGAECIGLSGIDADAETIAMAVEGINKLGIKDWRLVIGHVGLQRYLLSRFNLDSRTYRMLLTQRDVLKRDAEGKTIALQNMQQILTGNSNTLIHEPAHEQDNHQTQHMLDVLLDSTRYGTTMGGRSRHDIAQRLLHKRERSYEAKQIQSALDFFAEWVNLRAPVNAAFSQIANWIGNDSEGQSLLNDWQQTIQLLASYGIDLSQITIQADLTKNWEYYTGIVFGVESGKDNYIVGGGRYDELTRVLGSDKNIPAIGFAYYVDALLPLLPQIDTSTQAIALNGDNPVDLIAWGKFLRENNIPVIINTKAKVTVNIDNNHANWNETTYSLSEKDQLLKDLRASLL